VKNFRSKYAGETEADLERVMSLVLRAMGPIVVLIDDPEELSLVAFGHRTLPALQLPQKRFWNMR
jgi:hypothetical protein